MQSKSLKGNQLTSWLVEWSVSFSFYPVRKWHVNRILVEAGFYFCQWLEACKKGEECSVYFSKSRFISVEQRQRWEFLNPLVVSVLKFRFFSSAQSCWVAIVTRLLPHNPVRLTGYRFSTKWGQDQNPNSGHHSHKAGGLRLRAARRLSCGCCAMMDVFALMAQAALLGDPVSCQELDCYAADGIEPKNKGMLFPEMFSGGVLGIL